jgi:hypothetical protein
MTTEKKNDWQVYIAICSMDHATPRDAALKAKIPVSEALSSIRRLSEKGLVQNGGVDEGRSLLRPIAWREIYNEEQIIDMFDLEKDELYIKGSK